MALMRIGMVARSIAWLGPVSRRGALAALIVPALFLGEPLSAQDALEKRQVLWRIVSEQCLPHALAGKPPTPCLDLVQGSSTGPGRALLKDLVGVAQVLLIPTDEIAGIESPQALEPAAGAYWQAAWNARFFVYGLLQRPLPRDAIALAINSQRDRTQDQLHIHVDCLKSSVRSILRQRLGEISRVWSPVPLRLEGADYRAIRLDALAGSNPFKLVAEQSPEASADMGAETIVVIGATFPDGADGFVLLENRAGRVPGGTAHGEDLQDHSCALAGD
jgi:CDP-diacylglycerol pyrophosphatase